MLNMAGETGVCLSKTARGSVREKEREREREREREKARSSPLVRTIVPPLGGVVVLTSPSLERV